MVESYLRRKLLNRMQRRRSLRSNTNANNLDEPESRLETSSAPPASSSTPGAEPPASPPPTAPQRAPILDGAPTKPQDTRHPLRSIRSLGASQESSESRRSAYSRIRSASRALLFFRRSGSANHQHDHRGHQHSQQQLNHLPSALNGGSSSGSGSWRSTSSPLPGAGPATSQPQLAATRPDAGRRLLGGPQRKPARHEVGQAAAAASQAAPPRPQAHFIVPKVNTLKLPLVCLIKSLDGQLMREVFVHRYERGQYLIESLKVSVGLVDSKYFGLRLASSPDQQDDPRSLWLNLNESVCKQLKGKLGPASSAGSRSIDFYLRIKFYPPSVARIQDQFLRNYLWLQLRRDLSLGKLTSSMNNLTLLMACVLQYELGDHSAQLACRVHELNILPNQDLIEEQALELWRGPRLRCSPRHQVQMQFLRTAVILETYGFDYYSVRDHQRQRAYLLGFNYAGVKTVRNGRIVHHFRWHSLGKISYERRMIIFHIHPTEVSKRKQILGFKCLSDDECQSLYMRLLEQKYFFTVDLAYFDKSFLRPACLYEGADEAESAALAAAATANNGSPVQRFALSRATSTSSGYPGSVLAESGPASAAGVAKGPALAAVQCSDPHCMDACPCVCPTSDGAPQNAPPPQPPGTCQPAAGWSSVTTRSTLQRQQATFRRGSSALELDIEQQHSTPRKPDQQAEHRAPHQAGRRMLQLAGCVRGLLVSVLEGGPLVHSAYSHTAASLEQHTHRKWVHRLLELCLLVVTLNVLLKCTDLVSNGLLGLVAYLVLAPEERAAAAAAAALNGTGPDSTSARWPSLA